MNELPLLHRPRYCTKQYNSGITADEKIDELKVLPKGNYLCADCTEESRETKLNELIQITNDEHDIQPTFTIQQIVLSGILQWNYQLQVHLQP